MHSFRYKKTVSQKQKTNSGQSVWTILLYSFQAVGNQTCSKMSCNRGRKRENVDFANSLQQFWQRQ